MWALGTLRQLVLSEGVGADILDEHWELRNSSNSRPAVHVHTAGHHGAQRAVPLPSWFSHLLAHARPWRPGGLEAQALLPWPGIVSHDSLGRASE